MIIRFDQIREKYGNEVEGILTEFHKKAATTTGRAISEMSSYHFETGGKRIRALIPSYIYEVMGHNGRDFLPFGAAVEMIHNATLVHDDLQDGDEMRRSRPTVWKKYSEAQAINCGDAMFQYAYQILRTLKLDATTVLKLVDRAADATLRVIEGQAQEFIVKEEDYPGVKRYLEVIRGKTSGLFALPVVGALEACGVGKDLCKTVESVAMDLGVLFQVQDDFLDLYGDKGRDRRGTDIAEGKISYFIAYVNEKGSPADRKRLGEIVKKHREQTTDAEILEAIQILDRAGAKKAAMNLMEEIQSQVKNHKELKTELPGIHMALIELAELFLKPIQNT